MTRRATRPLCVTAVCVLTAGLFGRADGPVPAKIEYNRDVRPILSDNCFACHGPDKNARKAKLRLDRREDALEAGVIVPGKPDESPLIERVFATEKDQVMPPPKAHKTLTAGQKETLKRWVAGGAEYQPHWAYIPPKRPPLPEGVKTANPIDAFVRSELAAKGILPSPEADRRTLLRRLSLDLVGLPPAPEEVEAFLNDKRPDAYEKQVDRLLRSPHYGERMAQHWLDVARYADTVGYHGDQNQNVWAYRDYVINSFNANKPFDQFTVEQLAGDLLPNPTVEQRVATCFNRLNMMTREGGAQPKEYLAKYTADRIRTVGMAWLGSTFNCAECHNHKFDPITQKDFYSLGAFFADIKQWGVYQDYGYTPNPDLRNWSNDHPWPPEIVVESSTLRGRYDGLRKQAIAAALAGFANETNRAAFLAWRQETLAFVQKHTSGWETPEPRVKIGASAAPRRTKKGTSPTPPIDNSKPSAEIEEDGRVVFTGPAATTDLQIHPTPGWLASVRIELLPNHAHGDKIARDGDSTTVRAAFSLTSTGGKPRALRVRHAQANRYAPRYANGFEIIGVQGGWKTDPASPTRAHSAVFFLDDPVRVAAGDVLQIRLPNNALAAVRISTSPLAPLFIQHPGFVDDLPTTMAGDDVVQAYYVRSTTNNPKTLARLKALDAEILACREGKTPVMVTERTNKPLTIRVLARGNWMDESGEICQPDTPHFLPRLPNKDGHKLTRLDLARWLCSPENPLTARVLVNRLWKQFFGAGLSAQVDDLGAQGEPPSHPELLDWLAVEFRDSHWDVKHMVRLIVTSQTYRQSSQPRPELREIDPQNRLLASQNARRLEAEIVRDNALAITGLINLEMGGPPCFPYQPAHYYDALQFPDRDWVADKDERQYRRGVYVHWQRTFLQPMLANFDAPSREDCIALRTNANTPQQALTLLNDPTFVEAARVWAGRLLASTAMDDGERLGLAFERALARPPSPRERESLLAFLAKVRGEYRSRPEDAAKLQKVGMAPPASGDPVELAAWASVCRVILNLHETITRF